jgi:polysaccharide biosynthesis protein PslH
MLLAASLLPAGKPFVLTRHASSSIQREVRAMFGASTDWAPGSKMPKTRPFDVVHFNHLDAALYESMIPSGVLRVLDEHNVVLNQVGTAINHEERWIRRQVLKHERKKLAEFEPWLCNRMNRCLVCSYADSCYLKGLGVETPLTVVPNGVDLTYFSPTDTPVGSRDIVFVGTLDYDPCEKGVWFCCTKILPCLRREVPELRFVVVGRNPSSRLRALARTDSGIMLAGRVDDVRPYVKAARVFVVPLLSGSGTRLKILEAMAMGVPVVTTTVGVEGIDAVAGEHLLVADKPDQFAGAVLSLIRDPNSSRALATRGRRLVESKYGWGPICDGLLREYGSLLN